MEQQFAQRSDIDQPVCRTQSDDYWIHLDEEKLKLKAHLIEVSPMWGSLAVFIPPSCWHVPVLKWLTLII